jgi:polysaccharide biosynthesis/export protein
MISQSEPLIGNRGRLKNPMFLLVALFAVLPGCKTNEANRVSQTVSQFNSMPAVVAQYQVGCGDVLKLQFQLRPDWDCLCSVDVDGTLPLPESIGKIRVQGLTTEQIVASLSQASSLNSQGIEVSLIDARASKVTVLGPVNLQAKSIAYCGPEPVMDFLVRVGAIQTGTSNLNRVYLLRPNVAVGERADVFHVDVDSFTLEGDQKTNIAIQPGDQIYVGETKRSIYSRLLPKWIRPLYRQLVGMLPLERPRWFPSDLD